MIAQYIRYTIYFHSSKGAYTPTDSSRVQSSPVRLTKTRQSTLWLTYNGRRGSAYAPAESSRVESNESWCCMHHFRQSDSSDRAWRKKWI